MNERIDFFAGGYVFVEEGRLVHRGKEVLYLLGLAGIEASCCGTGGCAFVKIPGYILTWEKTRNARGQRISEVERIDGQAEQTEIRRILKDMHPAFTQIEFI